MERCWKCMRMHPLWQLGQLQSAEEVQAAELGKYEQGLRQAVASIQGLAAWFAFGQEINGTEPIHLLSTIHVFTPNIYIVFTYTTARTKRHASSSGCFCRSLKWGNCELSSERTLLPLSPETHDDPEQKCRLSLLATYVNFLSQSSSSEFENAGDPITSMLCSRLTSHAKQIQATGFSFACRSF